VCVLAALAAAGPCAASEQDADAISRNIRALHTPHRTVIDPVFASATSTEVARYTRGGDSAIWTGHYLAAEAFRYRVTRSPEALRNVKRTVRGIRALVDVTGANVLARCLVPVKWEESVDGKAIITEEAGHGVYRGTVRGQPHYWIGNTSRDQYCGVFFGLAVAYDMVTEADDPKVRVLARGVVTRLLNELLERDWAVVMPNGRVSTLFTGRVDQQLTLLQIGRHMNPDAFKITYEEYRDEYARFVRVPIGLECLDDHDSYFKFNLDYVNLYSLIRLEEDDSPAREDYLSAYRILRATTRKHGNAHFNVVDRALSGPDGGRDAETRALLDEWLERSRRDEAVDLRCCEAMCGENKACDAIPVPERVPTDFLWQRSPFQLYGGGAGTIETAGIDYILPYWMARYYGVEV
jgi:hypothetical protein